jgi:hypothetical protein
LSYCWGKNPTFKKLTVDLIGNFRDGIIIEGLPLSFRDAIAATRKLDLRYLWIDSLCIIQDSPADWKHEVPRMAQVYGNSYINLAATTSADAEGGLFKDGYPIIVNGGRGIFPRILGSTAEEYICFSAWDWREQVELGVLNQRGWVFQERVLAP